MTAIHTTLEPPVAAGLDGLRRVSLLGARHMEQRAVRFVWVPEVGLWASGPLAAARRSDEGKWFARRLIVRGDPLAAGLVDPRTEVMGTPARIERWLDAVPPARRSGIDNDAGAPDPLDLAQRERALGRHPCSDAPPRVLETWSGVTALEDRERQLRAALAGQPVSSEADLWRQAVARGLASRTEEDIAHRISGRLRPGRWAHAGD